ncbi:uncharacterized protein HMPREF1541_01616 [Cyphellophora europaea CBS 101466]|uniref:Uncharacterized protein n=1 Tax=Cyphellophora europaea (strain CBS 101466) TaxID=1220924 RepID=W2S1K7_CYPE1|nr:uncharacterized protein HMPREF1541_01616 [Cyphellophora europaea CBS 101466]ETN42460.1 hypothetical protein HMPREF1541_01616 [Cyphellophora europaea CBS 101466]
MTAQPQIGAPALDEFMDLASSPFHNVEDLELNFDDMENPEVHDTEDNQMDEMGSDGAVVDDVMQEEVEEELLEDENMLEEQDNPQTQQGVEFEMDDTHQAKDEQYDPEDDTILYDEDEEANNDSANLQQDYGHELAEDDDILEPPEAEVEASGVQDEISDDKVPQSDSRLETEVQQAVGDSAPADTISQKDHDEVSGPSVVSKDFADTSSLLNPDHSIQIVHEEASEDADHEREDLHAVYEGSEQAQVAEDPESSVYPAEAPPAESTQESSESESEDGQLVEDSAIQEALHAIRVEWIDARNRFPLFPSVDGDTSECFLHDTGLAYEPLDKLLAGCHAIVEQELGVNDELVLDVPDLGLHICEDSKYAAELTLAQIVDIYLMLKRNESAGPVTSMYCRISPRVCLETQYRYLYGAASDHRTYSSIKMENQSATQEVIRGQGEEPEPFHEEVPDPTGLEHDTVSERHLPVVNDSTLDDITTLEMASDEQHVIKTQQPSHETSSALTSQPLDSTANEVQSGMSEQEQNLQVREAENEDAGADGDILEALDDEYEPEDDSNLNHKFDPELEDSNSSHTVEGEFKSSHEDDAENMAPHTNAEEDFETKVDEQPSADDAQLQNLPEPEAEAEGEGEDAEYFYNSDEEFLSNTGEDGTENAAEETKPQGEDGVDLETPDDGEGSYQDVQILRQGEEGLQDGVDVNGVPPVTPEKAASTKRKAVDDDDFLDLSIDTPEPKRRRPS